MIDFIPKDKFSILALTYKTDKHYRSFPCLDTTDHYAFWNIKQM
ncbi:MAG: DUF4372 domain-containing protein [Saprospiraceae bacterium]|nr:DUF4372 domain-containing protein [Saprospiraceae bacterium]